MNGPRAAARAAACAGILLLAGCASPRVSEFLANPPAALPARAEIAAVPFHPQEAYQCGPAALAMALQFAGRGVTPASLVPQVYVPAKQGSLQAEMLAATRRHGLVAYELEPRLEALLREVAGGTPAIVLQNLALDWAPRWHYAVVIGYDLDARELVLRSGTTRRLSMSLDTFERTWARSGHWAMLALDPRHAPASGGERRYVAALAALERVSPSAARTGYATALAAWPVSETAVLGLGNASYALGDLEGAAAAYRRLVALHPDSGDGWNNLAQSLVELGRREEALAAARRAVAIGGARASAYRETLQAIERAR